MAGSPNLKVYMGSEYRAAFKVPEDAAAFASFLGDGATVRYGHAAKDTLWTEGKESFPASESYDDAADVMRQRMRGA